MYKFIAIFFIFHFSFFTLAHAGVLQDAIDKAPEGSILRLPTGIYKGSIVIKKPLTIIGIGDNVIVDGEGTGTVVTIEGSHVTLKNLKIINSGNLHHTLDSAIKMEKGKHCDISDCEIDDCLFGIDMQMVSMSIVKNNRISSKDVDLGLRGDGLRLWYSHDNLVSNNRLIKSRDMVVWYSHGNIIEKNYGEFNRYSLHFMYAGKNIVRDNVYKHNSVGIFFMYSKDTVATGNLIKSSLGNTGMGIGLKDVSNFTLNNNTILYCAKGFFIDRSPFEPDTNNWIIGNNIMYNTEALHFHSISLDNIIKNNIIVGNIEDVVNGSKGNKLDKNDIEDNYWDNYEGLDKNRDNIGDTPHEIYQYADQLWTYNPSVKFFYGSPVISLLNFLAKLAPFTEPLFLIGDKKPKMEVEKS